MTPTRNSDGFPDFDHPFFKENSDLNPDDLLNDFFKKDHDVSDEDFFNDFFNSPEVKRLKRFAAMMFFVQVGATLAFVAAVVWIVKAIWF